jgi:hypothetical protein
VHSPQLRARLDADLFDERGACGPIGLERLGLPARPVEGEHSLRLQPFPQRLVGKQ